MKYHIIALYFDLFLGAQWLYYRREPIYCTRGFEGYMYGNNVLGDI